MSSTRSYNVFVGAETGLLKGVDINSKSNVSKNFHDNLKSLTKEEEITCMNWDTDSGRILLGLRNRRVVTFDPLSQVFVDRFDASIITRDGEENFGSLRGVARLGDAFVTAAESGLVKVWRRDEDVAFNTIDTEVNSSGKLKKGVDFATEEDRLKHMVTLKADRKLSCMRQSPSDLNVIATGGKENDLQVWDLNRPETPLFRARNVKPDFLQLRVPVWVTDIGFPDATCPKVIVLTSRHGHVRMYDTRGDQRRPSAQLLFPEESITALATTSRQDQVIVGTAHGQVALFDFRNEFKGTNGMVRKYKGCVGSIRSLDCMRTGRYFASVGLDRFLRIYDVQSKPMVSKIYLKSRLNCVLLQDGFDPLRSGEEAKDADSVPASELDEDEEAAAKGTTDSLWDNMDVITEKSTKKSKKRKIR